MSPRPPKIEKILEFHLSHPRDRNNSEFIRLRSEILKILDFAGKEKSEFTPIEKSSDKTASEKEASDKSAQKTAAKPTAEYTNDCCG